jgi:hypothetical protein
LCGEIPYLAVAVILMRIWKGDSAARPSFETRAGGVLQDDGIGERVSVCE